MTVIVWLLLSTTFNPEVTTVIDVFSSGGVCQQVIKHLENKPGIRECVKAEVVR